MQHLLTVLAAAAMLRFLDVTSTNSVLLHRCTLCGLRVQESYLHSGTSEYAQPSIKLAAFKEVVVFDEDFIGREVRRRGGIADRYRMVGVKVFLLDTCYF